MEKPENAKKLARLIVKRSTGRELDTFTVGMQKELNGVDTDKRGIRIDVLVKVDDETETIKEVFDIEPNTYYEKDLAKRNRYYNALTDSKLLHCGDEFGSLPELITIWILAYDPFEEGRVIYTIKNIVKSIKGDAKVGERYMTLGTTLYYEKKMSYDEGIQIGKDQMSENLLELGVDPAIIKQAMETKNN